MVGDVSELMKVERPVGRIGRLFGVVLVALWLWAWGRLVSLPEDVLVTNVLVDDAFYFALPARHWWQGHGFSFDGSELTNGVQTLWALVCIALAGCFSEPMAMVRAMVGLSGLCWLFAAGGLYTWMQPRTRPGALVAAVGMAWAGVYDRVAFQGMENGLHALVGVLVLHAGTRAAQAGWSSSRTLWLGTTLALFGLSRTEGVLLGPIVGVPLVLGWLGGGHDVRRRLLLGVWLALPGVVLVGGSCLVSKLAFDSFLPISGHVKQFYEHSWGAYDDPNHHANGRGGLWKMAAWHVQFVVRTTLAPVRVGVPELLANCTAIGYRPFRNFVWLALGVAALVTLATMRRRTRVAGFWIAWCLAAYAFVHVVLIGLSLSHFTQYATWYFATEATVVWMFLGLAMAGSCGRLGWLPPALASLISVAGLVDGGGVQRDVRTNQFKKAGVWLREHTPPGTTIGALSSGLVGWYASEQHVVNLDGLINNRRYLDGYLRRNRFADYFADRGITWFADYQPVAAWKPGIQWCGTMPATRLAPRRYWRLPDGHAYAVWQVLPAGSGFEPLGADGPAVRDRYAELAVAADVRGAYPVVAAGESGPSIPDDALVVRSLSDGGGGLAHVYATPAQIEQIALTESTVHPEHAQELELAPGLHALGFDARGWSRGGQRHVAVTVFLVRRERVGPVELVMVLEAEDGAAEVPLAASTRRQALWQTAPGLVAPETHDLRVHGAGDYRVGLRMGGEDRVRWFTR